jgi:hypothetical protein
MGYNHEEYEKRAKTLLEQSRGYYIVLSTKDTIKIDSDEIRRVIEGIKTGSIVKIRQGIINPSFFVSIVDDHKRNNEFASEVKNILNHNRFQLEYGSGEHIKMLPEYRPLKDIFEASLQKIDTKNNQYLQRKN